MTNPWHLYERLVDALPAGITVTRALVNRWTVVGTDDGTMGVAMTCRGGPRLPEPVIVGAELREVAALVTSWDLRLASLGVAALNAWYAQPARLEGLAGLVWDEQADWAARLAPHLGAKPSAVVGHFPATLRFTLALPQASSCGLREMTHKKRRAMPPRRYGSGGSGRAGPTSPCDAAPRRSAPRRHRVARPHRPSHSGASRCPAPLN